MTSSLTFRSEIAKGFVSFFFSFPSLSPLSFLETTTALKNTLGEKEEKRKRQMRNRQKNGVKTFSPLLLKENGTTVRGGRVDRER